MKVTFSKSLYLFLLVTSACSESSMIEIKNEKQGRLNGIVKLEEVGTKNFELDSITAPRARYTQIYTNDDGVRNFTFLNTINNSLYFYDYETSKFLRKLSFKNGLITPFKPMAYLVKSIDSIYVYNMGTLDLLLADRNGVFSKTISLINNKNVKDTRWTLSYPQYYPQTAIPFLLTSKELLFPGQYMVMIPDSIINTFKFTAHIDLKTDTVSYSDAYPRSLYGFDYKWNQSFTEVYADLHSDGDKLVYSFPVSHDLYISDMKSGIYKTVYGGSNNAGTISSIRDNSQRVSRNIVENHIITQDAYAAIKYDPYRKVYYRFLRKGIADATPSTQWQDKQVVVIIMDKDFNYLGETTLGRSANWYFQNIFVTEEGLNIEYIENNLDETYLTLKIFTIKKSDENN